MTEYEKAQNWLKNQHAAETDRLNSLQREFDIADAIKSGFPDEFRYNSAYVSHNDDGGRVVVSMWFVKDRIADVLRLAAELGARQTKEWSEPAGETSWREYTLGRLEILFHYAHEGDTSGKACRRVKVGTRTVNEPVYEVVCN